jgi:hypothetical protein
MTNLSERETIANVMDCEPAEGNRGEHDHTPEEERDIRDSALDDTIAATFPASDPPSSIPDPDDHDTEKLRE